MIYDFVILVAVTLVLTTSAMAQSWLHPDKKNQMTWRDILDLAGRQSYQTVIVPVPVKPIPVVPVPDPNTVRRSAPSNDIPGEPSDDPGIEVPLIPTPLRPRPLLPNDPGIIVPPPRPQGFETETPIKPNPVIGPTRQWAAFVELMKKYHEERVKELSVKL
jgi:hypothetical protein